MTSSIGSPVSRTSQYGLPTLFSVTHPSPLSHDDLIAHVSKHIDRLWGSPDSALARRFIEAIGIDLSSPLPAPQPRWDETDVALITYGDSITDGDSRAPLRALEQLLQDDLADAISVVHVLPFNPYSSDRGFSVIDYTEVDPALGSWDDMTALCSHVSLMFDLVLNHISSESKWFKQFLADEAPGNEFIKTGDPSWDLSNVVRPRSLPLLTNFETAAGSKLVWTTFSEDQVDLDWSNPDLVAEMLSVIDLYVSQGARFVRLDAVAYIWKVPGTTSIHLPETHEMVKLLHTLLAARDPKVSIITETNVPDRENRTYFGNSDEAHLIYNFTFPPLAIDGVLNGRADRLVDWLTSTPPPPPGTTMFNFLASHDGIGVRPAEGFLSTEEIEGLVELTHERGGLHGTYDRAGTPFPYELNVSFPDLFGGPDDPHMVDRILVLHTIVLALAGVPALYINSMLATTNDNEAVERDGGRREINRGRTALSDVPDVGGDSWQSRIYTGIINRAALRRRHSAFHPDGAQRFHDHGDGLLSIERTSPDGSDSVTVVCNLTDHDRSLDPDGPTHCVLTNADMSGTLTLGPYGSAWLTSQG